MFSPGEILPVAHAIAYSLSVRTTPREPAGRGAVWSSERKSSASADSSAVLLVCLRPRESGVYGASHDGAVAFGHEHGILVAYVVPAHDYGVRPSRPASIFRPISVRRPVGWLLLLWGRGALGGAVPSTGSKYNS